MAAFVLIVVILLLIGSNEAVGYYYTHCDTENLLDCLLGQAEDLPEPDGAVTATGTYTHKGYTVAVVMNIPLKGGSLTGSVSDTCDGNVRGTFVAGNGTVGGTMSGVCSPFFVNIPAGADYTGTLNKTTKTVTINFTGRGGGFSHSGTMTLVYK